MFCKKTLVATLLGGFLLFGTLTPTVVADDCKERVRKAEEKVKKETDRHGEHSKQADQARHERDRVRKDCHMEQAHEPHEPR
jgi:hypothetical protein